MGLFGLVVEVGGGGEFPRQHLKRGVLRGKLEYLVLDAFRSERPLGHMDDLSSKRLRLWV